MITTHAKKPNENKNSKSSEMKLCPKFRVGFRNTSVCFLNGTMLTFYNCKEYFVNYLIASSTVKTRSSKRMARY